MKGNRCIGLKLELDTVGKRRVSSRHHHFYGFHLYPRLGSLTRGNLVPVNSIFFLSLFFQNVEELAKEGKEGYEAVKGKKGCN